MPRTLELLDRQLITKRNDPTKKGDGRHLVQKHGRIEVFADVKGGKIASFYATSSGRRARTLSVMEDPNRPRPRVRCAFCVLLPGSRRGICWSVPC